MNIYFVNGEGQEMTAQTLGELLAVLDYDGGWLATAVNGELVHASERQSHTLSSGDRIEILSPMQGG
jgi:sulfur carrier protein